MVTVHPETVALTTELPGRLESLRTAEVRAQVGGILQKRLFQEGSYVKAGQPLYQIDSSTYEANLESAHAQLASAQATLAKANATWPATNRWLLPMPSANKNMMRP